MSRYGTGMRNCCDSVNREGYPHIVGCEHYSPPFPTVENTMMTESNVSADLIDQAESLYDTLLPLMQADAPDVYGRKGKAQAAIVEALALRTPSDEVAASLKTIIYCNDDGPGLIDCIDNYGERYTSQALDLAIKRGRSALSTLTTPGKE